MRKFLTMITMLLFWGAPNFITAGQKDSYLCVIGRVDPSIKMFAFPNALIVGEKSQMVIIEGEYAEVFKEVDKHKNCILTAVIVITNNIIRCDSFPDNEKVYLVKTNRTLNDLHKNHKNGVLWANEGAPQVLFLTSSRKAILENDTILVEGSKPLNKQPLSPTK